MAIAILALACLVAGAQINAWEHRNSGNRDGDAGWASAIEANRRCTECGHMVTQLITALGNCHTELDGEMARRK